MILTGDLGIGNLVEFFDSVLVARLDAALSLTRIIFVELLLSFAHEL